MKKIVKNGEVILDGTKAKGELEHEALERLELLTDFIELLEPQINIDSKSAVVFTPTLVRANNNTRAISIIKRVKEILEQ